MMLTDIKNAFSNPAQWVINWARGWDSDSEERRITSEKALSYAPIWAGVNKIAGHVSQLPICVYKRLERGADRDRRHNVHQLMRRPNPYQSSVAFREQIAVHSLLEGNGRAVVVRSGSKVAELIPLHPDCTATLMLKGVKVHATRPDRDDRVRQFFDSVDGSDEGVILLDDLNVLHIMGLSLNGFDGIPLRKIAQRNIGASINTEKRLATQMEKGFAGNMMLNVPSGVFRKAEDAEQFLEEFERRHSSPDKAGKVGMLREGITANLMTMNNQEAEMTENRKFQRQDAALWLGLEQILGDDSSVSYNSLEQKNLAYLMNCLNKWLKRWEEEMEFKLLPERQFRSESHYIRFNTAALLKSDYKTSVESLSLAIGATIISPNEAREKLDMNPYEGGDVFQNPAITPGESMETDDAQPEEPEDEPQTTAALAVQARLQHLIGVESNRVKQAAAKAKNYVDWMDKFYATNWLPKFADALEDIGMDRGLAVEHCEESKRRLLEVCDFSNSDTLPDNVSKCVSNWKARAANLGELTHV